MIYPEIYKVYKKTLSIILIFTPAYLITYFYLFVKLKLAFSPHFKHWCSLSHDCNPYNFLINQTLLVTAISVIIVITLLSFLIVSSEYINNTFVRICIIKHSVFRILAAKLLVGLSLVLMFLFGQYLLFKHLVVTITQTYPDLFAGYQFVKGPDLINLTIVDFFSILKIIIFQYTLSFVCQRFFFIPVTIGLLGVFSFLFPFSPYGMLVRTNWHHQLDFMLVYGLLSFAIYVATCVVIIRVSIYKSLVLFK